MLLSPGTRLRARGLTWDVLAVEPCGPQTRLRVRCSAGDLAGLEWDLLHPWDKMEPLRTDLRPDSPASVAAWRLHHIARLLDREPGAGALLSAHPGRVALEPYQLVPVLRALEMPRPRLLLADAVGLGKTVQAGMIAAELILRRRAHRIIVVTPAGPLLAQWARELLVRFGLRPTILGDAAGLRARRREIELGGNPFESVALCLTSLDFAKQDPVLAELERSAWDLAIIDEAHHCVGNGATDTQRRRLAEVLAVRAEGLLLLTATPHDGNDAHFASLMGLLDPGLVDGEGRLLGQAYRRHVVRRLKAHVRDPVTGRALFRERTVTPLPITLTPAADARVLAFHQALAALIAPRLRRGAHPRHPADTLAFVGLLKRSVSTLRACVNTLAVVADRHAAFAAVGDEAALRRERARALRTYRRRLARYGVLSAEDERDQAELEAQGMAAELHEAPAGDITAALRALIRLGEDAAAEDPKLRALAADIRAIRAAEPDANILVYTEYADSQDAARDHLLADPSVGGAILTISGADPDHRRAAAADRFATEAPIILVSTDSLAEGLNLHQRCRHLIHLDLPYNPNRLEQRNGRIDRYGQRHEPDIRYPYLAGTFEERLLLRLIAKYERARLALDVMPETIGVTAEGDALGPGLVAGFAEEQAPLFPPKPSPIRGLDRVAEEADAAAYRDLLHEIDRAYAGFERMAVRHGWLTGLGAASATRLPPGATRAIGGRGPLDFLGEAIVLAGGSVMTDAPVTGNRLAVAAGTDPGQSALLLVPPAAWHADLSGLPGHDPGTGGLRATADPALLRDAQGREVACPGWAHPLVRRVTEHMRAEAAEGPDPRIAVARGQDDPSVLLTYALDLRDGLGSALRDVIAVRLYRTGPPRVIVDPAAWLALAQGNTGSDDSGSDDKGPDDTWSRLFAAWVPDRGPDALALATEAAGAITERFRATHDAMLARETRTLTDWLNRRTTEIAGPWTPPTPDLFGDVPEAPDWKTLPTALDRLAAFTADATAPAEQRRDAAAVLALFRERTEALAARTIQGVPAITPIGMLMLRPDAP